MNEKVIKTLEYKVILDLLAENCAFAASSELARNLLPTCHFDQAKKMIGETSEALRLIRLHPEFSVGGVRDVRKKVDFASRGGVLEPNDLLDIKFTIIAARNLARKFEKLRDEFQILSSIIDHLPEATGIVSMISKTLSDEGDILDSASRLLSETRRDQLIIHERLMAKLQKLIGDSKNTKYLQEALITQRDGRYVIPLRAEYKGRIKAIVHDQSSSGATLFVEPVAVVALNNRYRELQLQEREEVNRILTELSNDVGLSSLEIKRIVELLAEFDFSLAKARYAEKVEANEPKLIEIHPKDTHNGNTLTIVLRLLQAKHPLLDQKTVVPIDIELDPGIRALVITGPNTGGKTVSLKTVGLLVLMAQSGLFIPAQSGSELSVFHEVFADIGDEQSIEQSLSTFSGHIKNIINILAQANQKSLVLLDELGAGTDPQEGAALAKSLLDRFVSMGIATIVTTHHPELKVYAHSRPGVINASVEFDLDTLSPTYRLIIGLPGRSNALEIAKRLGLPDEIVEAARSEVNPDDLKVDDLLDEILRQRELAKVARNNAEKFQKEIEQLHIELLKDLDQLEDERSKILQKTKLEAEKEVEELKKEISRVRLLLKRAQRPEELIDAVEKDVEIIANDLQESFKERLPDIGDDLQKIASEKRGSIEVGDNVFLKSIRQKGIIIAINGEEAEVQIGILRIRTKRSDISLSGEDQEIYPVAKRIAQKRIQSIDKGSSNRTNQANEFHKSPGIELDLRGKRADEALDCLEIYLDSAFLSDLPFVRIIHGKGTGKLRSVVREALSSYSQVASIEGGRENEGGDGVTIVKIR